ncbi:beta-ketoacyl synthase N-terminal-like domain-containing protein [Streptomyces sp. NPDC088725]|uniref:beta-ketoacyl synthase N-terminal-like domain-containing protein n=1 Tax=Streptomyces sp. NPDC088725 TaxID=3365873 RepID=UPI00381AB178
MVVSGADVISGFPADRGGDLDAPRDSGTDERDISVSGQGGFPHRVADFDPGLFGISPRQGLSDKSRLARPTLRADGAMCRAGPRPSP